MIRNSMKFFINFLILLEIQISSYFIFYFFELAVRLTFYPCFFSNKSDIETPYFVPIRIQSMLSSLDNS